MSTAHRLPGVFRYLTLVGVAAAFIGGTMVFALNQAQSSVAAVQMAKADPPPRPSYLMPLPKLSARDFDVSRSVAVVVRGKDDPKTVEAPKATDVAALDQDSPIATTAMVTAAAANVRSGPSKSAPKTFVLRQGDAVEVLSTQGGWSQVTGPDGQTGWIWSKFLRG